RVRPGPRVSPARPAPGRTGRRTPRARGARRAGGDTPPPALACARVVSMELGVPSRQERSPSASAARGSSAARVVHLAQVVTEVDDTSVPRGWDVRRSYAPPTATVNQPVPAL